VLVGPKINNILTEELGQNGGIQTTVLQDSFMPSYQPSDECMVLDYLIYSLQCILFFNMKYLKVIAIYSYLSILFRKKFRLGIGMRYL